MLSIVFRWLTEFLNWYFDESRTNLPQLEAKIRRLERGSRGPETLFRALKLVQSKFDLDVWFEGSSKQEIEVRDSRGRSLTMGYKDGLYWCWRPWGKEAGTERYASLELLVWQIAGHGIPRIVAKAQRMALHQRKIRRHPDTRSMLIPSNIYGDVFSKEFRKYDGVWHRTRWYHRMFPQSVSSWQRR